VESLGVMDRGAGWRCSTSCSKNVSLSPWLDWKRFRVCFFRGC